MDTFLGETQRRPNSCAAEAAADNGSGGQRGGGIWCDIIMTEGCVVKKIGSCVFSILMFAKEAVCPDGRIIPAVFRVSNFYFYSLIMTDFLFFLTGHWNSWRERKADKKFRRGRSRWLMFTNRLVNRNLIWAISVKYQSMLNESENKRALSIFA